MKRFFIAFMLIAGINANAAKGDAEHLLAGAGIYGLCIIAGSIIEESGYDNYLNSTTCLIPVAVIGAGKEIYDSTNDNRTSSWEDFAYTMAIPVGMSIVLYKW